LDVAVTLAALLAAAPDEPTAIAAAEALGFAGSSWAWRALGPGQQASGLVLRGMVARALVPACLQGSEPSRRAARRALAMVEHPDTRAMAQAAMAAADADGRAKLEHIIARIEARSSR